MLHPEIKVDCINLFKCQFHECYGTSEVGIVTNLFPDDLGHHLKSVGKALSYVYLKIVNKEGKQARVREIGEIICKTKTAFSCYYKLPEETSSAVKNQYFYTGDLGYLDEAGYLYLSGRKKDVIIIGGVNVFPQDIEEVIAKVKGVKEVAVIGVKDEYFGEAILAVVSLESVMILKQVKRACLTQLADYQQPMAYEMLESLPRNGVGKIMKPDIRKQFQNYNAAQSFRVFLNKT